MNPIDFSPLQGVLNEMALRLLIYGLLTLCLGYIIKFTLVKIKVPNGIASTIACLIMIYFAFNIVVGILEM